MAERFLWLDAIRALAAQIIVLHHLSIYGPVAETLAHAWPVVIGWLDDYGRMAVQVFLVLGGLLATRSVSERSPSALWLLRALGWRYARLFVPFYVALGLVMLAAIPGRAWLVGDWVPQGASLSTVLAHLFGLFDYLGIEALTAGAWYVTMDWQLHAVALGLFFIASKLSPVSGMQTRVTSALVALLGAASLLWVNRQSEWDAQPLYFFGSFALGMASGWLIHPRDRAVRWIAMSVFAAAALALLIQWRLRIAISLSTAIVVALLFKGVGARFDTMLRGSRRGALAMLRRAIEFLGDTAYSLFLVHFAVCVLINALFARFTSASVVEALLAFVASWALSLPLAAALHRFTEDPLLRWKSRHG